MTKDNEGTVAAGTFEALPYPAELLFRRTRYFEIDSVKAGARYAIWVTLPFDYDKEPQRSFPVVYAPDGNSMTLVCSGVSNSIAAELIDPLDSVIQICVGYTGPDALQSLAVRARDLLPPKEYLAPGMADTLRNSIDMSSLLDKAGRELYAHNLENPAGERFLAFLSEELHPFIAQNFRARSDDLALWGHSYGGLFSAYAAMQSGSIFTRFGSSSPGIVAEHSVVFQMYRDGLEAGGLSERSLHMTIATRELTDPTLYQTMVGAGTVEFMQMVGATPMRGMTFSTEILANETHMSVLTPAYYSFLRTFYRNPKGGPGLR